MYIKSCVDNITTLTNKVQALNNLNYYDINTSSENFFMNLLNQVYGWNLKNANAEVHNATAIDLYDAESRIAVQVTSDSSSTKIKSTVKKFTDEKLYDKYDRLVFLVIKYDKNYRFTIETDVKFKFDINKDIITSSKLLNDIKNLNIDSLKKVAEYLEFELGTALQSNSVWSISTAEEYMKTCSGNIIDLDFFEIDDKEFTETFENNITNANQNIFIKGFSKEETLYCILNHLRKMNLKQPVYIIKNLESWQKASGSLVNSILISFFQSDEIASVNNNINIFIYGTDDLVDSRKCISLRRRTKKTLRDKLSGKCEDSEKLIDKTNGLFPFIKNTLFKGQAQIPEWAKKITPEITTALLLGKWTDCDGDKQTIETLSGVKYTEFIEKLTEFMNSETPFVIITNNFGENTAYSLADTELAWSFMYTKISEQIKSSFLSKAKEILSEMDPLFNEPFEKHFLASIKGEKSLYSKQLKNGIAKSLIFLATNGEQLLIDKCIEAVLSTISSLGEWGYISQYSTALCEASPEEFLKKLERSVNNAEFLQLFTYKSENSFTDRHYYVNILWALECLFRNRMYIFRAAELLIKLSKKIDKCPINNSPIDTLSAFFCTWYNITSATADEKISFAETTFERYPHLWDLFYEKLNSRNHSIMTSRVTFIYRMSDDLKEVTNHDLYKQNIAFLSMIRKHTCNDSVKWCKLLQLFSNLPEDLLDDMLNQLSDELSSMPDNDKECIKTELRQLIHSHRYFSSSGWKMSEKALEKLESFCKNISFVNQMYEYLYLTLPKYDIPLYDPYPMGDDRKLNEEKTEIVVKEAFADIKRLNLDISMLVENQKSNYSTDIGQMIAQYYSLNTFEEPVFIKLLEVAPILTIAGYVQQLYNGDLDVIKLALRLCTKHNCSKDLYARILAIATPNKSTIEFVLSQPKDIQETYFCNRTFYGDESFDVLPTIIKKCIEFGAFNNLLRILDSTKDTLPAPKLLEFVEEFPMMLKKNNGNVTSIDSYLIEKILKHAKTLIDDDIEKYEKISGVELWFYKSINWDKMLCTQHLFKTNPSYFAELLKIIFKTDDGDGKTLTKKEQAMVSYWYDFYMHATFCPGEINGKIDKEILCKWVSHFKELLNLQKQTSLFKSEIGRLFAFSPVGEDGCYPHEHVRELIETYYDDELSSSYSIAEFNKRGVYTFDAGEGEKRLAELSKENANKIRIKFPKTATLYDIISRNYFKQAKMERERAENGDY